MVEETVALGLDADASAPTKREQVDPAAAHPPQPKHTAAAPPTRVTSLLSSASHPGLTPLEASMPAKAVNGANAISPSDGAPAQPARATAGSASLRAKHAKRKAEEVESSADELADEDGDNRTRGAYTDG